MSPDSSDSKTCWNCDEAVENLTRVVISTPSGGQASIALCPRCFATVYRPLEQEVLALRLRAERRQRVLLVDDDPETLGALSSWLDDEGFTVVTAANGLEALQRVRDQVPEVIVLDLQMPVMSGQEFLAAWRSSMPTTSIPVVAMSGYDADLVPEKLGVQAFLPKPFCLSALTRAILNAVA
jgi:CheY-like chemotaxis protein